MFWFNGLRIGLFVGRVHVFKEVVLHVNSSVEVSKERSEKIVNVLFQYVCLKCELLATQLILSQNLKSR